ncbi:hypothetical protein [Thermohalobacter berrensis]|uniref:Uncharacterized protein n=1 Tax=Thermohalobacter berrensis TaxID=99594 RepID=A0A419T8H2_9FIRM|nr:hypothetical protein [Thermohalobacter berrensis]RKD33755.1 hypothetical protein BET03_08500 [Thermohalobacter berrensis]
MADYYINLDEELGLNAVTKVLEAMSEVKEDDTLIISMDSDDAAQSRHLAELLENNGFEYLPKGSHSGEKYTLIAHLQNRKEG